METIKRNNGNDIKIYATTLEDVALEQIKELGEFEPYQDSKIRIMPDCHAGSGCTIGTTMEIKDKITPNLVGVDIGCGMLTIKIKETDINLQELDKIINEFIPNGFYVHSEIKAKFDFARITCSKYCNLERASLAIGSLGGGNHFIEVGKSSKDELFLIIHSGSRNIGKQVAIFYQNIAIRNIKNLPDNRKERELLIAKLKKEGRQNEIGKELKKLKKPVINKDLAYLTGIDFDNYMHDMKLMQEYAVLNRKTIASIILKEARLSAMHSFETIHNYIDFNRMILRKGAVSAEIGETLLIPINMRDGSIIAKGKGNADWNYSAPHGAGRLMGRKEAHRKLDFGEFKEQMKDVYSTSVLTETLDEAPNAYKPMNEILEAISETADVLEIIKPIYNFKAHS
jgi:tRNA-splicing ligase RtcB